MEHTELFLSLAEIAGVFVGFGALIAVRTGSAAETAVVSSIRWVMSSAIWVVIVALAPIIVTTYGVGSHELWFGCGLLALALLVVLMIVLGRTPENRADVDATFAAMPRTTIALVMGSTFWLPMAALVLALAAVFLGVAPGQDEALYLTAVGFGLLQAALQLLVMVFWKSG